MSDMRCQLACDHGHCSYVRRGEDAARASAVRYFRAMAVGLKTEADRMEMSVPQRLGASGRFRDHAMLLESAALDVERKLDLDPDRLRELEVIPMNKTHCRGCWNDVYNGQLAQQCWLLPEATIVRRYRISIDSSPVTPGAYSPVDAPSCYSLQGYAHHGRPHPDAKNADGSPLRVAR